jgi:hypothetical protein
MSLTLAKTQFSGLAKKEQAAGGSAACRFSFSKQTDLNLRGAFSRASG